MNKKAMTGNEAVAYAIKQIDPEVIAAYPITPQTQIIEIYAKYYSNKEVNGELIDVESEHSAMSATIGAAAAGVRAMTTTSSQGLALMAEMVYIAASMRLPILMPVVNRALSGPINIHCDHSDTMLVANSGWLQLYSENTQDIYDNCFIGLKIAEELNLPVMVCQDGFITSHCVENMNVFDDKIIKKFIGEYKPKYDLLNKEITVGPFDTFDYYFEHKRKQAQAMFDSVDIIKKVFKKFSLVSGRKYDFFEEYKVKDAEKVIVIIGSTFGTTKNVVDSLREKGDKVGVLGVRVFRPFNYKLLKKKLSKIKNLAVMERYDPFSNFGGILFNEVRSSLGREDIVEYIYGLGGRDVDDSQILKVFNEMSKGKELIRYVGVRE
ncbi:MAG TPA: pyruvate ferredoxin oxidoreductase [Candidatus Nanoarchaeia archaeon]|nr:pyruvate ferredoxin oxidoreductase [Candidatus Nanoarchaeia archaeon]